MNGIHLPFYFKEGYHHIPEVSNKNLMGQGNGMELPWVHKAYLLFGHIRSSFPRKCESRLVCSASFEVII